MNYKILEVESKLFGRNIILLDAEETANDYTAYEKQLIQEKNPYYIQHQLDAGDLSSIHAFESLGFRFCEFRIFRHLQLNEQPFNTRHFFPFYCELVADNTKHKKALHDIVAEHISDDRFSRDPLVSNILAQKRLELYISKSLTTYPKQFVYGIFNHKSEELIGFRTGIFAEPGFVKYFYYFMKKEYNDSKYSSMLEAGVLEALYSRKVNRIEAVSSGLNVQEMNDTSLMQGFVVDKTMVLLRKIF